MAWSAKATDRELASHNDAERHKRLGVKLLPLYLRFTIKGSPLH